MSKWWIMLHWTTQHSAAFAKYQQSLTTYTSLNARQYLKWELVVLVFSQFMWRRFTLHTATFESLHSQRLNLCIASLSDPELSCRPLCSPLFDLVHSWKLLPRSLTHSCVFEAGEHPHTHTSTDPGSWLVLNPWQGALSLNIKDPHLRACRHDSHPGLSSSQQATERPTRSMWRAATAGRWSDAATSPARALLGCICRPAMWTCENPSSVVSF